MQTLNINVGHGLAGKSKHQLYSDVRREFAEIDGHLLHKNFAMMFIDVDTCDRLQAYAI